MVSTGIFREIIGQRQDLLKHTTSYPSSMRYFTESWYQQLQLPRMARVFHTDTAGVKAARVGQTNLCGQIVSDLKDCNCGAERVVDWWSGGIGDCVDEATMQLKRQTFPLAIVMSVYASEIDKEEENRDDESQLQSQD